MNFKRISAFFITITMLLSAPQIFVYAEDEFDSMTDLLIAAGATGVQYALIDNGEIALTDTAGVFSLSQGGEVEADDLLGVGSVSKTYVAACVLKLCEQGLVDLDESVVKYIPEFEMADERYTDITVRMLLNHSSGLMGSSFSNAFLFDEYNENYKQELLESLRSQRLKADPGAFSVYCNDGFTLAEILVERVSGKSYSEFLRENISQSLGLENTFTPADDFNRERLVKTYSASGAELPADTISAIGSGGVYATAEDLCKFSKAFLEDSPVLSEEYAKMSFNPEYKNGMHIEFEDNTLGYGLGWDTVDCYPFNRYDIRAVSKGGDTLWYHSSLVVLPEYNMSAAVISSGGSSVINQMFASRLLLERLLEKGEIEEILPDKSFEVYESVEMPEEYLDYAGMYGSSSGVTEVDLSADGTMTMTVVGAEDIEGGVTTYKYTDNGVFVLDIPGMENSARVKFVNEENGETYITAEQYVSVPGLGQTAAGDYFAEKLELPEDYEVSQKWRERSDKKYYLINEQYNSQVYQNGGLISSLPLYDKLPGYILTYKIKDDVSAISVIQIPGSSGRDLGDIEFYTENGIEYMESASALYIAEDGIESLYFGGDGGVCTIQPEGYARWYKIPSVAEGGKISVDIPENASFSVFDSQGNCVFDSYVNKSGECVLPARESEAEEPAGEDEACSYIVFSGCPGSRFDIMYE